MPITSFSMPPAVHTLPVIGLSANGDLAVDRDDNRWERSGSGWTCTHSRTGALGQTRTAEQVRERQDTNLSIFHWN